MNASQFFNTWLGLAGLAVVLFYVFNDTQKTTTIIQGVGGAGTSFVNTLEARGSSNG
jgi:hypothetical protein